MLRLIQFLFGVTSIRRTLDDPRGALARRLEAIELDTRSVVVAASRTILHRRDSAGRDYYRSPHLGRGSSHDRLYVSTETPGVLTVTQTMPTGLAWFYGIVQALIYVVGILRFIAAQGSPHALVQLQVVPVALILRALLWFMRSEDWRRFVLALQTRPSVR